MIDFEEDEPKKSGGALSIVVAGLVIVVIGTLASVAFVGFINWMQFN